MKKIVSPYNDQGRLKHTYEERRFMYQNRPSKLHQLPFDQGVQILIYFQVQWFMYQNGSERYLTIFNIIRTANVFYDFVQIK